MTQEISSNLQAGLTREEKRLTEDGANGEPSTNMYINIHPKRHESTCFIQTVEQLGRNLFYKEIKKYFFTR